MVLPWIIQLLLLIDSAKNTETVLALWKDWKDGDLSKSRSYFADTVSFFLADGSSMSGPADNNEEHAELPEFIPKYESKGRCNICNDKYG